jgi:hypothetical protein
MRPRQLPELRNVAISVNITPECADGDRLQARIAGVVPRNEKSPGGLTVI